MSVSLQTVLQSLLRPSEVVKVALETTLVPINRDPETSEYVVVKSDRQAKKILVVVSHLDSNSGSEQGCVFVFKPKTQFHSNNSLEYTIEHVFPVVGTFSISMAQPRRGPVDLSAGAVLNRPRTEFMLTIKAGHDPTVDPLPLLTDNIRELRSVIAECKHLKEAFPAQPVYDVATTFSWIAPYLLQDSQPPLLSPIPPDLRGSYKPVHTILSPASAGFPGDEALDIALIREDWMRNKVREELVEKCNEKASIRIRTGTFNVNGKMPSQDLSVWVQGRMLGVTELIPPLAEISPLSLGEVVKDPMDDRVIGKDIKNSTSEGPTCTRTLRVETLTTADSTPSSSTASATGTVVQNRPEPGIDTIEDSTDPDLIVLAFQELDLSTEALLYSTKTLREDAWCMAAFAGLGEKAVLYEKLTSRQLVGMLLVVIVKKRLKMCFGDIKTTSVGAGIMGVMGNKGATAIRLTFTPVVASHATRPRPPPTVLTFVNSHLAAFEEMYERRNADFHDLSKRLVFDSGIPVAGSLDQGRGYVPATIQLSVFETDALFWMVNLNYRINLPDIDVRTLLSSDLGIKDLRVLLSFDQLGLAMRTGKAFEGFHEHAITHIPSYRFTSGVPTDSRGYDMKRKPAWTDRVLHMASSPITIRQLNYYSCPQITMSDHRPVSAEFELEVPVINMVTYESFIHGLWRDVASMEDSDDNSARVRVSSTSIDFGKISYKRRMTKHVDLENFGKIPCTFRFVSTSTGAAVNPEWLEIQSKAGLLLPCEKTTIAFSVYVDHRVASRLNMGPVDLEWTLILHVALGKDHFISVNGQYERTCFAMTLAQLTRLPRPARALRTADELLPEDAAVAAPREIMRLVNWLMSNAVEVAGLFVEAAEEALVDRIHECLDTGADLDCVEQCKESRFALAVGECLLQLLAALPEPVVPIDLHPRCVQMTSRDEAFELLNEFPKESVNVWISITAFLYFIGQISSSPTRTELLVAKFSSVLLKDDDTSIIPVSIVGKRNFLRYFVE
ncbi:DNase I-like protein [Sparassis latifolia]